MPKAHILEARNGNGWGTTFCGRIGEKKTADGNSFLSASGKTFFMAYPADDAESLNAYVNCTPCQRAYDALRAV